MYTFVQTLAHLYIFVYNRYVREINKKEKKMVEQKHKWDDERYIGGVYDDKPIYDQGGLQRHVIAYKKEWEAVTCL